MNRMAFLTFASTNWQRATERFKSDLARIQEEYGYFSDTFQLNENDLGREYFDRFSPYFGDPGFAYWSWKPYAIMETLKRVGENDFLFYLDGGCTLPMNRLHEFLSDLDAIRHDFGSSGRNIALTGYAFPNEIVCRKEVLRAFGLEDNEFYRKKFLHYQAGVLILRNNVWTRQFITRWFEFFRDNYAMIRAPLTDNGGQMPGFGHNGGDQAIFQCMLFTENVKTYLINDITSKYTLITRDRG